MKWMLVVMALGSTAPMPTGLIYDSLKECIAAEASIAFEWNKVADSIPPALRANPKYLAHFNQIRTVVGTCIPHN